MSKIAMAITLINFYGNKITHDGNYKRQRKDKWGSS